MIITATPQIEIHYVVDPQMGVRTLDTIRRGIDTKPYKVGDSIESVAYRQGQEDLLRYIETNVFRGKI